MFRGKYLRIYANDTMKEISNTMPKKDYDSVKSHP